MPRVNPPKFVTSKAYIFLGGYSFTVYSKAMIFLDVLTNPAECIICYSKPVNKGLGTLRMHILTMYPKGTKPGYKSFQKPDTILAKTSGNI